MPNLPGISLGPGAPLFLICGPCVIESAEHALGLARKIQTACAEAQLPVVFKASYDKANRTSLASYRGPGPQEGLAILAEIRRQTGLPVLTDVHSPDQVGPAAEAVDVLQIPAFLCRQTDLLVEAGRSGKAVNIKKGQFLAPWDMRYAAEKVVESGGSTVILTERGTTFGYQNLVVDFRGLKIMQDLGYPVVLDVTHSLQLPGAGQGKSGGQPEFIEPLARAGVAAGVDGLFFETHETPGTALSDGANALPFAQFPALLAKLRALAGLVRSWPSPQDA